jgi:hypothetical protein
MDMVVKFLFAVAFVITVITLRAIAAYSALSISLDDWMGQRFRRSHVGFGQNFSRPLRLPYLKTAYRNSVQGK